MRKNDKNNIISIEITNNLRYPNGVLIMNALTNPNNQANAKNYFQWSLASETFTGITTVTIYYYLPNNPILQSKSAPLLSLNFEGVAATLSSFNIGFFFSSTSVIFTFNDNFDFQDLVLT